MKVEAGITSRNIEDADGDEDLTRLLHNWARWANHGDDGMPQQPTTCASAERHHPIPIWENEEAPPPPPDEIDGQMIEDAIAQLPAVDLRRVLRIHYHRLPDWWMRRLAKDNGEDFKMHVADQRRARMMEWPVEQYYVMLRSSRAALRRALQSGRAAA